MEALVIDFLCLRSRWCVRILGPFVTLFIVQSKGWPFIAFWWGVFNFIMLFGAGQFANHWLFWQDVIAMCNGRNPSGHVTDSTEYKILLVCLVVVSFVVAAKRFWLGLHLGRKTFGKFLC